MSYEPQRALAGPLDFVIDKCIADAAAKTKAFDAETIQLGKTWKPTGIYTVEDVRKLVGIAIDLMKPAWDAVTKALESEPLETQVDNLRQSIDDLSRRGQQAVAYLDAARKAKALGKPMNAPELKVWLLYTRNDTSSAMDAAFIATCVTPSLLDMVAMTWFAWGKTLYDTAVRIVGLAKELLVGAYDATKNTLDFLAWLARYGPPITVGALALWLFWSTHNKKKK